jgi:macrolide-specific efflux system membrane fusion protein
MKKWITIILAILVVGGGVYYYVHSKSRNKQNDRQIQTYMVLRGTLVEAVESTGSVQPLNRVEIKPPISGRIEKLLAEEGDKVKAGQILGWMSSTDRAAILDAARAKGPKELKRWQNVYKPTPIVAPLSGTLILKNVVVGQTIDASTVIYAMSDKLIVKANVDEADIAKVHVGMPAVITLDSYPNEPLEGHVVQLLQEGVNTSNVITYGVKIEPQKIPPYFRSLMTANIRLISAKRDNVLSVPASAVQTLPSGEKQVLVRGADGKPVAKPVEVGLETPDQVEITSGLNEGDQVLVVTRRYVPQEAAAGSPLVPTRRPQGGQGSSGGRGRSGNN